MKTSTRLMSGLVATLALTGCGGGNTRPFVAAHPKEMGDLYWNGALNDHEGHRWDVDIVPGIAPTGRVVGDSWKRAGGYIADTGKRAQGDGVTRQAFRYAGVDIVRDFVAHGVRDDYVSTTHELGQLWREAPFGWTAQWLGRSVWGYVLKPTGRLIVGTVTASGAVGIGAVTGSVEAVGRTAYAAGDITVMGTIYPAGRLAWHQPAWLFSIINREPDLSQDGHWGLHVVR